MDKIKSVFGILVVVVMVYLAVVLVPPYFHNFQFQDFIDNEARQDTYNGKPEADIRKDVMRAARDNSIPITDEQLTVQRGGYGIAISTAYSVHVDIPFYPLDLKFTPSSQNKMVTAP